MASLVPHSMVGESAFEVFSVYCVLCYYSHVFNRSSMEQQHGLDYITSVLEGIGLLLSRPVTAYHIGGNAMCVLGVKSTTKDTDLVFLSKPEVKAFLDALPGAGFMEVEVVDEEYGGLDAFAIFEERASGNVREPIPPCMRVDLFYGRICHGLKLSTHMVSRSTGFMRFGYLENRICSKEDVFLFKALAGRPRDVEDMSLLARVGLDWVIVGEEFSAQKEDLGKDDLDSVRASLEVLTSDYGVSVPQALMAEISDLL